MAGHISTVDLSPLLLEIRHDSELFPEDTNRKVELTAGAPANTWSDWAEIEDDTPVTPDTLSSKFATQLGHISGILIEDLSDKEKRYQLEVAYGDAKTRVLTHRFLTGDVAKKLAAIQFIRIRAEEVPAGETIYYKMKCETAGATCEVSFRYHYHP
ncbi:hypothetical protein ES703_84716 [subsurface metagenome]